MTGYLFHAKVLTAWQHRQNMNGSKQYVVAEAGSRSAAVPKAMRKVYALEARNDVHSVELVYLGTVEVAR